MSNTRSSVRHGHDSLSVIFFFPLLSAALLLQILLHRVEGGAPEFAGQSKHSEIRPYIIILRIVITRCAYLLVPANDRYGRTAMTAIILVGPPSAHWRLVLDQLLSAARPSTVSMDGRFRSTPLSRPSKAGLKCLSARPYVRPSVHPQKVSSISMKFCM